MLDPSIFNRMKSPQDFAREEQEFQMRKRQREMQEQLGQLQLQQSQIGLQKTAQELMQPKMPFSGQGLEVSAANEAYKNYISMGLDDATARQRSLDDVLGSKQSLDARGNVISRRPIFNRPMAMEQEVSMDQVQPLPPEIMAAPPREVMALPVSQVMPAPIASDELIPINPADFGVTSPYAQEDIRKAQAEAAIQERVDMSRSAREEALKERQMQRENETAYNAFSAAMRNVDQAMSGTATGPLVGSLPAITPEAQIAKGATSTLAPILKQLFRTAGEGTFTDKDQDLLMEMVPTRNDFPEAREQKIRMIDEIVRAKLNMSPMSGSDIDALLNKYAPMEQ